MHMLWSCFGGNCRESEHRSPGAGRRTRNKTYSKVCILSYIGLLLHSTHAGKYAELQTIVRDYAAAVVSMRTLLEPSVCCTAVGKQEKASSKDSARSLVRLRHRDVDGVYGAISRGLAFA